MLMEEMIKTRKVLYQVLSEHKICFWIGSIDRFILRNFVEQFHSDGQQYFIRNFFQPYFGSCDAPDGPGVIRL